MDNTPVSDNQTQKHIHRRIDIDSSVMAFPPTPGLNYIAAIRPSLNLILVLIPLGSMLVPLILTLFFFSPSRRHPVFILNILVCCIGICEARSTLRSKQNRSSFYSNPFYKNYSRASSPFLSFHHYSLIPSFCSASWLSIR